MTQPQRIVVGRSMFPIGIACVLVLVVFALSSDQPAAAVNAFFLGPLSNSYAFGNMLAHASLLLLTGLGAVIAFQTGSFNLGGEGQTYAGAATAAAIALGLGAANLPAWLIICAACAGGTAVGGGIAGLSAYSRKLWNADELITSFLVGSAMIPLVDYLFRGPMYDSSSSMIRTAYIAERLQLAEIFPPSLLSTASLIALMIWLFSTLYLEKGVTGSRFNLSGSHPEFALSEGLKTRGIRAAGFTLSGALHGMTGALLLVGMYHAGILGFSSGYGWNGIAVALIARNRPRRVLPASLIFSYIIAGSRQALVVSNLRLDVTAILQAVIFLLITVRLSNLRTKK